jgi:hypothetical protein
MPPSPLPPVSLAGQRSLAARDIQHKVDDPHRQVSRVGQAHTQPRGGVSFWYPLYFNARDDNTPAVSSSDGLLIYVALKRDAFWVATVDCV